MFDSLQCIINEFKMAGTSLVERLLASVKASARDESRVVDLDAPRP